MVPSKNQPSGSWILVEYPGARTIQTLRILYMTASGLPGPSGMSLLRPILQIR